MAANEESRRNEIALESLEDESAAGLLRRLLEQDETMSITVGGMPALEIRRYDQLDDSAMDDIDWERESRIINDRIGQRSSARPAREVLNEIREKYGI